MTMVAGIFPNDDPPVALTMDGQALPVTAWGDGHGEVCAAPEARFCTAGPDAEGATWLIDIARLRKVRP